MEWLKIDNPEIDAGKIQKEIEDEVARLKAEKKLDDLDPLVEKTDSLFSPDEGESYILKNMEKFVPGIDWELNFRRAFFFTPLVKFGLRVLSRILRHQFFFNSLTLEVLRDQEERIKALEDKITPPT